MQVLKIDFIGSLVLSIWILLNISILFGLFPQNIRSRTIYELLSFRHIVLFFLKLIFFLKFGTQNLQLFALYFLCFLKFRYAQP